MSALEIARKDGIGILTLNRPEVLNAIDVAMADAIRDAMGTFATDSAVGAILLTGAGRGFCAGADLRGTFASLAPEQLGPAVDTAMRDHFNPMMRAIFERPVPVIAAVNGTAAGGGVSLVLGADIAIAAPGATFILPFVPKLGFVPDLGASALLSLSIGRLRARAATLLGDPISAQQAKDWGLVFAIEDPQSLMAKGMELAARLASVPRDVYRRLNALEAVATPAWLSNHLEAEREAQAALGAMPAFAHGVSRFLEKK